MGSYGARAWYFSRSGSGRGNPLPFSVMTCTTRGPRSVFTISKVCTICAMLCPSIGRSEEHTSELQSRGQLVCRLLLEKKKRTATRATSRDRCRSSSSFYYLLTHFSLSFFSSLPPPPLRSPLFPYTTLFRSRDRARGGGTPCPSR